ncbi:hypothetical protein [Sulfitobacter sp. AS59]|uniref:hypothetical protein n=1 Tax=Sulfitobacter sp. AS59 TaxID=3135784 RepID=UPI003171311B
MILFDPYAALDEIEKQASSPATSATSATILKCDDLAVADVAEHRQKHLGAMEAETVSGITSECQHQADSWNIVSLDAWRRLLGSEDHGQSSCKQISTNTNLET